MSTLFENMMAGLKNNWQWYDMSALKICVLFFGLWIAKVWPVVLGMNSWTYFAVWLVLMVYLLVKLFK